MKTVAVSSVILLLLVGTSFYWLRSADAPSGRPATKAEVESSSAGPSNNSVSEEAKNGSAIVTPHLVKSTRYPPVTAQEKAMWEWWRQSTKADPKFEWKMPIEFYGKVVDQSGNNVGDAEI